MKLSLLSVAVALGFIFAGCDEIFLHGNGILTSETRNVAHFDGVISSGEFIVLITRGDDFNVSVEAESNLLPYIKTGVSRGRLEIWVKGVHNLNNTLPMKIYVVMPVIKDLDISGSGKITTGFFTSGDVDMVVSGSGAICSSQDTETIGITVSGSGKVEIDGNADFAGLEVSGSGMVSLYDLQAKECNVKVSGSGRVYVNVSDSLEVSISGSGAVYYKGHPQVDSHISGSGRVVDDN